MNNMMIHQHTQIKASFEISMHMVGHVFNVTLYKKLLGMISIYGLNEIFVEYECLMQTKTLHVMDVSRGPPTIFYVHVSYLNMLLAPYH